jgi:hypothetical protein
MDWLLDEAGDAGIRVILSFVDNWKCARSKPARVLATLWGLRHGNLFVERELSCRHAQLGWRQASSDTAFVVRHAHKHGVCLGAGGLGRAK